MKSKDFSYIIIIALLFISAIVSWNVYLKVFHQKDTVDIHQFPREIDGWTSRNLIITESEYEILETRNAFVREYTSPEGEVVRLFIVYSQNNRKVSHPPEICYVGGGVTVLSNSFDFVRGLNDRTLLKANKLVLEQGVTQQVAFYWFKVGDSFTSNYLKQQALIVLKTLFGRPSSSALIRVSSIIGDDDNAAATEVVRDFAQMIIPHVNVYLP